MDDFDTPRLRLRLLQPGDEALYRALYTDPAVMTHVGTPLSADAAGRAFAAACRRNEDPDGVERRWAVLDRATGAAVGLVAMLRDRLDPANAELGVMLLTAAHGRGLARELNDAVVAQALMPGGWGLDRLWARHAAGHAAAARALAASGFAPGPAEGADATVAITRDAAAGMSMAKHGRLACVGLGMMLGAHLAPRARAHIEEADVVFGLLSDPVVELWLQRLRPDLRSLQPYYGDGSPGGKPRSDSYREMVEALVAEARAGRRVCGVFYGHPGVFAEVPHRAIARARAEGLEAVMEPGISAEDCLYADVGFDPGAVGCQHYEASQFMFNRRRIDPSAWLVLWQVGIAGDRSLSRRATGPAHRRLLVELLCEVYPLGHQVIAYEAATLPIAAARVERMPLSGLVDAELNLQTTLAIPPAAPLRPNDQVLQRLAALEAGMQ